MKGLSLKPSRNLVAQSDSAAGGSNSTVPAASITGNGQPIEGGNASENPVDTSADSTKLPVLGNMPLGASENLSKTITATMPPVSRKTLKNAKLRELRSKIGLVAGALADFQSAGGVVVKKRLEYTTPSGNKFSAIKLLLIVENANLVAVQTEDGLEFEVMS